MSSAGQVHPDTAADIPTSAAAIPDYQADAPNHMVQGTRSHTSLLRGRAARAPDNRFGGPSVEHGRCLRYQPSAGQANAPHTRIAVGYERRPVIGHVPERTWGPATVRRGDKKRGSRNGSSADYGVQ